MHFLGKKLEILKRFEYFINVRQVYIFSSIAIDLSSETEVKPKVASVEFRPRVDSANIVSDFRMKPSSSSADRKISNERRET